MSKKIKYILLFVLFFLFLFISDVRAEVVFASPELYRKVSHESLNGVHSFTYTIFLDSGRFESTILCVFFCINN